MAGNKSVIKLSQEWTLGKRIAGGGFAQVYEASSADQHAVIKMVPKAPGADRELLFAELGSPRNVIPIIDRGEHGSSWVLVMPRAETSLRAHIAASGNKLGADAAAEVLKDICDALIDLDGKVVHRDLKPENVLRYRGHWCLADFGISRYADSSTASDTRKFAWTPQYAAPEQWKHEHATSATDIYALGVMAFEMTAGNRPFSGPSLEDFRHQHLHVDPPPLSGVPPAFASLVDECLFKDQGARPTAANVRLRLERIAAPPSPGLAKLQEANREEVRRIAEHSRRQSEERSEGERRALLANAAKTALEAISTELESAISSGASAAQKSRDGSGLTFKLNNARLTLLPIGTFRGGTWGKRYSAPFDVVCYSRLELEIPNPDRNYEGRSHSIWFGDVKQFGQYGWFETAFMLGVFTQRHSSVAPFALDPGDEAANALGPGIGEYAVAWPFTPVATGQMDEFIDRWIGWFAQASQGHMHYPGSLPERDPQGSWRRG